jgi:hypothetical protein
MEEPQLRLWLYQPRCDLAPLMKDPKYAHSVLANVVLVEERVRVQQTDADIRAVTRASRAAPGISFDPGHQRLDVGLILSGDFRSGMLFK